MNVGAGVLGVGCGVGDVVGVLARLVVEVAVGARHPIRFASQTAVDGPVLDDRGSGAVWVERGKGIRLHLQNGVTCRKRVLPGFVQGFQGFTGFQGFQGLSWGARVRFSTS